MAMASTGNSKTPREEVNITRKTSEEYLPDDVLETILLRLPLKSILRFKAVSKSWNDLTLDPRFGRIHASRNRDESASLFMWFAYQNRTYRLARLDGHRAGGGAELDPVASDLRFPRETFRPPCFAEASCDGFFLLCDILNPTTCALWNPVTGSSASFPSCPNGKWSTGPAHGICYDSSSDDYKVVYVSNDRWYAVYSCGARSWTENRELPRRMRSGRVYPWGVTVRGVAYWISVIPSLEGAGVGSLCPSRTLPRHCYEVKDECTHEIVYFDGAEESCGFKTLARPEELGGGNGVIRLTSLDGRLCLYRNSYDCRRLQIWLLKQEEENSSNSDNNDGAYWVKLANVRNLPLGNGIVRVKPLYLTRDQRIVLQCDSIYALRNQSFIRYDIWTETSERVWTRLDDDGGKHSKVYTGLGSLVLPARENHS